MGAACYVSIGLKRARSVQSTLSDNFSKINFSIIFPYGPNFSKWLPSLSLHQDLHTLRVISHYMWYHMIQMQHVTPGYLKQMWKMSGWLYEDQHGFRPAYSCESQVAAVCQDIAVFNFFISNIRHVLNFVCFIFYNPRCLNFICRRFGTICLFHFHRQVGV